MNELQKMWRGNSLIVDDDNKYKWRKFNDAREEEIKVAIAWEMFHAERGAIIHTSTHKPTQMKDKWDLEVSIWRSDE